MCLMVFTHDYKPGLWKGLYCKDYIAEIAGTSKKCNPLLKILGDSPLIIIIDIAFQKESYIVHYF